MPDPSLLAYPNPGTEGPPGRLAPDAIRDRLGALIGRYLREGSAELARSVVAHLEALCQDPELRDVDRFCAYRRLARHWRWLSAQHGTSAGDQA